MIYASREDCSLRRYTFPASVWVPPDEIDGRQWMHAGRIESLRGYIERRLAETVPWEDVERVLQWIEMLRRIEHEDLPTEEFQTPGERGISGAIPLTEPDVRDRRLAGDRRGTGKVHAARRGSPPHLNWGPEGEV